MPVQFLIGFKLLAHIFLPNSGVLFSLGTALVVQWLILCAPNAGDQGSISGQGTRSRK